MKHIIILCLAVFASGAFAETEYYTVDPDHTYPHFAIDHMGFSTLYGRFDETAGKIIMDRKNNNGFINIDIASVSINTGHIKRDNHLRSPDFLNVMEFPNIRYESKNVKFVGNDQAKVEGVLTMMGVSKPVNLSVNRIRCGVNPMSKKKTCGFEAVGEIKRSDFGSKYGYPNIGDNMKLWFEVEAVKED